MHEELIKSIEAITQLMKEYSERHETYRFSIDLFPDGSGGLKDWGIDLHTFDFPSELIEKLKS